MIKVTIQSPSKAILDVPEADRKALVDCTSYKNKSIEFQYNRHLKNKRWRAYDPNGWKAHGESLSVQIKKTLLFQEDGDLCIKPGFLPYLAEHVELSIVNNIDYPKARPYPWYRPVKLTPHPYQKDSVEKLIEQKHGNVELCTGCHQENTEILMYDGSIKKVQDVKIGDLLMGPDSGPRKVTALHTGEDEMYKIIPIKGESFVVNREHILSLQYTNTKSEYRKYKKRRSDFKGLNTVRNISVADYLNLSVAKKHKLKLYRVGVKFQEKKLPIPPRILGMWLGDGASSQSSITTMDAEIEREWSDYMLSLGLCVTKHTKKDGRASTISGIVDRKLENKKNNFQNLLKQYNLIKNKHIPQIYLTSSRSQRLELLAGLIDTDGHLGKGGTYEIVQKNTKLAKNILYLARSLGFAAYLKTKISRDQYGTEGVYNRINISGNLDEVPVLLQRKKAPPRKQVKNVLRTGFSIQAMGKGTYYGFSVDKDRLYLMGDFTVTHNSGKSLIIMMLAQKLGLKTIVVTPSDSIFREMLERFESHFGKSMIGALGGGKKRLGKPIMICISNSLANLKEGTKEYKEMSEYQVLIADESHTVPAATLEKMCHGVLKDIPYRFFLSGTQTRNDGTEKLLHSIIGKTVHTLSTKEAIDGGYICDHEFRIVKTLTTNPGFTSSDAIEMKRMHFLRNDNIAKFIGTLANSVYNSRGEQTLVLVDEIDQIHNLIKYLTIPYACATGDKSFDNPTEAVERFNKGEVKVLVGTSCISTGTNIYPTHHTVNWQGGTSEIKTKQGAVGRSVRKLESSEFGDRHKPKLKSIIWDFDVQHVDVMERHLKQRIEIYKDSGTPIIRI